ncbi:MAG TPA: GMC family oxidoreductase [Methylomirabilota bacterium]|nr:GMC family oxidoreductase [Methylomirabilota bacterium]
MAILTEEMMGTDEIVRGYLQMAVNTLYHPVSTARMGGPDDAHAVVDQYGRVRGLDNLRLADASIMPNIPRANTNLTCIMIGERIADWLRAE